MKYLVWLGASLLFVQSAAAQENRGGYVGFSLASFDYEEDDADQGVTFFDDSTSAYRAFGGYRFNEHLAVEGVWGRTKTLKTSLTDDLPGIGVVTLDLTGDYEAFMVRTVGVVPFDKVNLLGAVGYYQSKFDVTITEPGFGSESDEVNDDGALAMVGFEIPLRRLDIRTELEWFNSAEGIKSRDFNVGLLFRF